MNKELYRKIATKAFKGGLNGSREVLGEPLTDNQLMKAVGKAFLDTLDAYDRLDESYCEYTTADGHKINIGDTVYCVDGKNKMTECKVNAYLTQRKSFGKYSPTYTIHLVCVKYYDLSTKRFESVPVPEQTLFSNKQVAEQLKNSMV